MQAFIDHVGQFSCEIIGDEIYFFSPTKFNLLQPGTITALMKLASSVLQKFNRQIDYYNDERAGNRDSNNIAPSGRQLRSSPLLIWLARLLTVVVFGLITAGIYLLIDQSYQGGSSAGVLRLFASLFVTLIVGVVIALLSQWWQRRQK